MIIQLMVICFFSVGFGINICTLVTAHDDEETGRSILGIIRKIALIALLYYCGLFDVFFQDTCT